MRWIVRICVALVACVVVAVGLLFMLPTERIGQLASDQLEKQTGRKLTLSGAFRPTIFPVLGVKTGRITVSNADWATEPEMVVAEGASVGVNLSALIGGNLQIETLELIDPVVHLERAKDGRVNWDLSVGGPSGTGSGPSRASSGASTPSLELGRISNGRVVFADRATGEIRDVRALTGTVSVPRGSLAALVDMTAILDGQDVSAKAEVSDWKGLIAGQASKVQGNFGIAGAAATLNGTVALQGVLPAINAQFEANVASVAKTATALGVAAPAELAALTDVKAAGQVQVSDAGLFLNGDVSGAFNGKAISGTVNLSGDESFLTKPRFDVGLNAKIGSAAQVRFEGGVGTGKTPVDGSLQASASDLPAVLKLVGVDLKAPKGTAQSGKFLGRVSLSDAGVLRLPRMTATLDKNTVTGDVVVTLGNTPYVEANLSAKQLDLSGFVADGQSGGTAGSGSSSGGAMEEGWSKEPIALEGLDAVNADIALKAAGVDLGVTKLGLTNIRAKLRDGKLTLRLVDVRAYQGAMSGTVSLRGGKSVAFASDIRAKDVQLEPMLGELLDIDRLRGSGTTNLSLSGQGGSLHAIMTSLSGKGDVTFGQGSIRGIDLAAMMRNLKSAFGGFEGATEFSSLTGSFSMDKGVLQNVDLSLLSPLFRASGKGSVDVGGQAMNYVVTPTRLSKDAEVSVPVIITGPWRDLKFRPDLEKLLDLLLDKKLKDSEELRKAKEKLKAAKKKLKDPEAAIKKKIKKKLAEDNGGVEKSLEEEVKDKLEDEIGNALKKLFD